MEYNRLFWASWMWPKIVNRPDLSEATTIQTSGSSQIKLHTTKGRPLVELRVVWGWKYHFYLELRTVL
jgi:hypothetical protein